MTFNQKWIDLYAEATRIYGSPGMGNEAYWAMEFLSQQFPNGGNGMIEIGSGGGVSFHCWAQIFRSPRISVDMPEGGWGGSSEKRRQLWQEQLGSDDLYSIIGNSQQKHIIQAVEMALDDRLVDWLFIDADHEYEACWADFRNYRRFVRPGGYIGFHDTRAEWAKDRCGRAWREIRSQFKNSWESVEDAAGLGIVQVE